MQLQIFCNTGLPKSKEGSNEDMWCIDKSSVFLWREVIVVIGVPNSVCCFFALCRADPVTTLAVESTEVFSANGVVISCDGHWWLKYIKRWLRQNRSVEYENKKLRKKTYRSPVWTCTFYLGFILINITGRRRTFRCSIVQFRIQVDTRAFVSFLRCWNDAWAHYVIQRSWARAWYPSWCKS